MMKTILQSVSHPSIALYPPFPGAPVHKEEDWNIKSYTVIYPFFSSWLFCCCCRLHCSRRETFYARIYSPVPFLSFGRGVSQWLTLMNEEPISFSFGNSIQQQQPKKKKEWIFIVHILRLDRCCVAFGSVIILPLSSYLLATGPVHVLPYPAVSILFYSFALSSEWQRATGF